VIPLRDENPSRTVPYIVYGIIILNIIVFLYNGPLTERGGNPLSGFELVPRALTTGHGVGHIPPWMTILTSMFLHANWLHIGANMLYLWIFGNNIEDVLGHGKFLFFYLLAGVAAALAQVLAGPTSIVGMVGASGAIAGVLGAYIVLFPRARVITLVIPFFVLALPASIVLGFWIFLQVINSLMMVAVGQAAGGVAYSAHVGGFVSGVAMIMIMGGRRLLRGRRPVEY
jgi:membrane associated rhomboid family serine protease